MYRSLRAGEVTTCRPGHKRLYPQRVTDPRLPETIDEWEERLVDGLPPTPDDQSRTWDGRVLDTKEKVLAFLAELDEDRNGGPAVLTDRPTR